MRRLLIVVLILGGLVSLSSCDHELDGPNPKGQEYVVPSDAFQMDTITDGSADFASNVNLQVDTARFGPIPFNEEATWKIVITGRQSGAQRTISGTKDGLYPEDAMFAGVSDNVYFFKQGEFCDAVLIILGTDIQITDEFRITRAPEFSGILVGDFEATEADVDGDYDDYAIVPSDGFNPFFDNNGTQEGLASGVYPDVEVLNNSNVNITDIPRPVQGDHYIYMRGKDDAASADPFFIGGFNNSSINFGLEDRPLDEIYLNFYASSNGNPTTKLVVELTGVGGDLFRAEKQVIWSGWRLISIKLSEFVLFQSGELGPNVIYPQYLKQLAFQIHSGNGAPGNEAEIAIDYIVFTTGSPFKQTK